MKKFMKKAAAAMIAMLAVAAVFGTSVPAQAASKAPKSLSVKVTTKTVDIKGKSTISVKSVKPANASKAVIYKSSDKKIATVSSKGVVTGKKAGKVNITVTVVDKTLAAVSKQQVYVSPEWLKSAMSGLQKGYENVFVSEVAWGDTAGDKNYNAGHIPGAYHINSDAVEYDDCDPWPYGDGKDDFGLYDEKDVKPEDNFNIRSAKQLGEFLKRNGITQDTKVVLYGKKASDSSVTRVAFAMLYAGVKDVKVVDGGMEAWTKAGYATETKVNEAKAGGADYNFGTTIPAHPEYILSADKVKEKLQSDANFRLVSIRSEKEFRGEEPGYPYIKYAGEPLGAVWGHNTDDGSYIENGKVVGLNKVKSILAESDSSLDNELSFYCGTGWRATIPFLICYQNGIKNISVFDSGWWAWQVNWQKEPENWPIQKVSPKDAKTYGQLKFAKKEVTTDSEGHKLMALKATVAENKLTCWPARVRKNVTYGYGSELSNQIVNVDQDGNVKTIGSGNAIITAKTPSSDEVSYKIYASRGEDYLLNWDDMYLDADTVLKRVKAGTLKVLDIRFEKQVVGGVEAGYAAGHIEGSMWAPAWPTKTAEAQANVRKEEAKIKDLDVPTVIVCMAGEQGAQRAAAVLMDAGVAKKQLYILTGGGKNLVLNYKDQLVTGTEK